VANEWEFQGDVLKWMSLDIKARPGLRIADVGQEKQYANQKRSDLVIWQARDVEALAAVELKTVATDLSAAGLHDDVIKKARRVGAPYCVLWNMRCTVIHATPPSPPNAAFIQEVFTDEPLSDFPPLTLVSSKDYVGDSAIEAALVGRARDLLSSLASLRDTGAIGGRIVEPSVFVEWLGREIRAIRRAVSQGVKAAASSDRNLRARLQNWATAQGMGIKTEVLYERAAAQLTYRMLGQVVFYLAYAIHMKDLPAFRVDPSSPLRPQLQSFWRSIRAVDYEALYADDAVLDTLPLSPTAEAQFVELLQALLGFNWASLDTSVLGAVFEHLIPLQERDLLGQYFTSPDLADLIVSFCIDGSTGTVLDPACGTGEFLVRSYDRLRRTGAALEHEELLDRIWGVDISHFPTELAVINLCRQDFSEPNNFPRVVTSDFFDVNPGDTHFFPAARAGHGQQKVPVVVPHFDAVVGNPPYLRWQKLDDLDPAYRSRVQRVAIRANVGDSALLDIYVLFFIHALDMLKPGGRVGFVTSNAWLTTEYGVALQLFLLRETRIVAIIGSEAEPFFPQAAINTVVTVAEKPMQPLGDTDYPLRFTTLKRTISDMTADAGGNRWSALDGLVARIEGTDAPVDDETLRIRVGSRWREYQRLQRQRRVLPWHVPMRAPRILLEVMPTEYEHA
jgi:methylase of polypeptide subunit release factors